MRFHSMFFLVFLGMHANIFPMGDDEKGYHSESDKRSQVSKKWNNAKTAPRKNNPLQESKKKRHSLTLFRESSNKNKIKSEQSSFQEKNTEESSLGLYTTALYVLGERSGKREQFIAIQFLENTLKNTTNLDRKTKHVIAEKIKKYYIKYYDAKTKAYFISSQRFVQEARKTTDEIHQLQLLQTAQKKIEKSLTYLELKMQQTGQSHDDCKDFKEISDTLLSLMDFKKAKPEYINNQIVIEAAKKTEEQAQQHLKLAQSIKKRETTKPPKRKEKTVTAGLLHMLGKKKKKLDKLNAKHKRNRTFPEVLTESMQPDPQDTRAQQLTQAQDLLIGSARTLLVESSQNKRLNRLNTIIETVGDIEEEEIVIKTKAH